MKRNTYIEGKTPPKKRYEEPTVGDIVVFKKDYGPEGEHMIVAKRVFPPEGDTPGFVDLTIPGLLGSAIPEMVELVRRTPWISVKDLLPADKEIVMAADNSRPYKSFKSRPCSSA